MNKPKKPRVIYAPEPLLTGVKNRGITMEDIVVNGITLKPYYAILFEWVDETWIPIGEPRMD